MLRLSTMIFFFAAPAAAWPLCDDLWLARNQLFDRAGYCFSSPLGQAVFDNAGCTGIDIALPAAEADLLATIQAAEAENDCDVDTSRTALESEAVAMRLQLELPVVRSSEESACLNWLSQPFPLLAGPRNEAEILYLVQPGQDIIWEHDPLLYTEGWDFVTVRDNDETVGMGYYPGTAFDERFCGVLAG